MKAKRKLKNFDFEQDGAHVALVGKHQGGPANGYTTLVTKGTKGIPITFVEKAEMVRVTLTMQNFLRKFFSMYYEDAEILAQILGYETSTDGDSDISYDEYIQSKVDSVEIMKNLFKADDVTKALSEVTEEQFEKLLEDQVLVEKAMSSKEAVSKQKTVEQIKEDVPNMSDTETVQKAELETLIEKALSPLRVELTKANETIETYKAKELELTAATRLATLKAAVKDEEKATSLAKSFANLTDEDFASTVETLKAIAVAGDTGEMFKETGLDSEVEEPAAKNYTREALEKKFAK
jgi:hypothetical protein